ncbi:ADP-heptose:LPS heptosyltransferase [Geodermatophilus bullaregiensis]|uniref:glycosyltransferase family 9 protein n=1 Tax=Geodermatophilus bullaregiensis TaxID=1564160 RepID=UPI001955F5B4|nr:glycosyltransferase family 9 protein [Geodermatophilus bullaregiensis]MBM7808183.1 ADP-heptose:LPS heptosyltransferase [Geodermatophilus bullaregiensis]
MPRSAPLSPAGALVPGVERIAVLRANWLGDLVLTLPALAALRAAYPDAEITYLGAPWHPELLAGRPGPWDRVVVVPPWPGVRDAPGASRDGAEVHEFLSGQRDEGYDLALQLHGGGGNSNPFVAALGARVTAGARDVGAPPLDRWLPYCSDQHEVLRCLEVAGLVGAVPTTLEPRLAVTPEDAAAADGVLPPGPEPLVALHPGAQDPRRRWPAEHFAALADALAGEGTRVVLVGAGDADRRTADAIRAAAAAPLLDLVGRLPLGALAGVLARCRLVVANDSGPRHLAEAVGTATVGVFLERNLLNAGPLTRRRHRVAVSAATDCPACGADQRWGRCGHDRSLVAGIPVATVLAAALDLLQHPGPAVHAAVRFRGGARGTSAELPGQQPGRRAAR